MAATLTRAAHIQSTELVLGGQTAEQWAVQERPQVTTLSNTWMMGIFFLLVGTFLIYFHTVLIENQANRKQQAIIELQEQNASMHARLAELGSLAAVEARASQMGMQPVEKYHYISIDPQLYKNNKALAVDVSAPRYPVQTPVGF